MPRPPVPLRAALALVLATAASGCWEGASAGEPRPAVVRLSLSLPPGSPAASAVTAVATLEVPAGAPADDGARRSRVALPPEVAPFDQVLLGLDGPSDGHGSVRVSLVDGDSAELAHAVERVSPGAGARTLRLDLAADPALSARARALEIDAQRLGETDLVDLTLLHVPPGADLPRPEEGPAHVDVEGESRPAVELSRQRPLEAELPVRLGPGVELRAACALPGELAVARGAARVDVVLLDGERELERVSAAVRPGAWCPIRLPLDGAGGPGARLRFELRSPDDGPASCALAQPSLVQPGGAPPTVVLVTSDTHRADHLGTPGVATPVLDELARRGVLFEDCLAGANLTNPSHSALMTGTHPLEIGIQDNVTPLAPPAPTLAEAFASAGWATVAATSAAHLDPSVSGLGQGFDRFHGLDGRERSARETVDALEATWDDVRDLPLFVWVHVFDAHAPYEPPEPFASLEQDAVPPEEELDGPEPPQDLTRRELELFRARYRAEVRSLDRELGRVLERPRVRAGVVALTADHGESLGEFGLFWSHGELTPPNLFVPLVLAWPGAPAGTRVRAPVRQIDVGRTLLDLAGLDQVRFPGRSLRTPVEAGAGAAEPARFAMSALGLSVSVTRGPWHLIAHLREHESERIRPPRGKPLHGLELYRREGASWERVRELEPHRELVVALRAELLERLDAIRPRGWAGPSSGDPELHDELVALGYADARDATAFPLAWSPTCACEWCSRFPLPGSQ